MAKHHLNQNNVRQTQYVPSSTQNQRSSNRQGLVAEAVYLPAGSVHKCFYGIARWLEWRC